jgi:hypothetical protein
MRDFDRKHSVGKKGKLPPLTVEKAVEYLDTMPLAG